MHIDDFGVSNLLNEKFDSISKTLAASILSVPFTTEWLAYNEKSFFFYPTDCLSNWFTD